MEPFSGSKLPVPARVVIVGCVERLMHVPDKMQKKLERE